MANECIPIYQPGQAITAKAEAAVTGKRFVAISHDKDPGADAVPGESVLGGNIVCSPCGAGLRAFGVADRDAAINAKFVVLGPGHTVPVRAGTGGVTAGDEVESDGTGQALPLDAGVSAGIAINTAAAGEDVFVRLH
jgi:hypothetical protein